MPRNRFRRAIAARARRSFVAPREMAEGDELVVRSRQNYDPDLSNYNQDDEKELLVLNTAGEWQPALSLFEYVQQSLVELCAGYIEASADKASDEGWEDYVRDHLGGELDWRDLCDCDDARGVYARPVGLTRGNYTSVDTLLSCVTPQVAADIIERRRKELAGIRILRLVAVRLRVPHELVGQIESFVAPAKDSVPFRRDELPGFMQSLSERYEYEAWDCHLDGCIVSAGHLGGAEIWKGKIYGKHLNDDLHKAWILLPRRLLQQYEEQAFVFSLPEDQEEWPADAIEVWEPSPGRRTYIFEDADGESWQRTFECFVLHPYFVEWNRREKERWDAHYRRLEEQRRRERVRMQLELAGLERGRRPYEIASRTAGGALTVAAGALLVWAVSAAEAFVA
jgi:hypothetical protein